MTLRQAIRNYLYPMTLSEVQRELDLSVERDDNVRADHIRDYIKEEFADETH